MCIEVENVVKFLEMFDAHFKLEDSQGSSAWLLLRPTTILQRFYLLGLTGDLEFSYTVKHFEIEEAIAEIRSQCSSISPIALTRCFIPITGTTANVTFRALEKLIYLKVAMSGVDHLLNKSGVELFRSKLSPASKPQGYDELQVILNEVSIALFDKFSATVSLYSTSPILLAEIWGNWDYPNRLKGSKAKVAFKQLKIYESLFLEASPK